VLTGCAFSLRSERGEELLARPVKPFGRGRSWLRVDAGPMQIQSWEGAALSRVEGVLQGTTHGTVRAEIGYREKVSRRLWVEEAGEGIGLTARQRKCGAPRRTRVFELERVVSCPQSCWWWRTKLDFGSGEPSMNLHRSNRI